MLAPEDFTTPQALRILAVGCNSSENGQAMPEVAQFMRDVADEVERKDAEIGDLKASLAHMGGHLEIELEEADKLRAEIAKLRAALDPERLANIIGPLWMGHPKEQDVLDETVWQIRDGIVEQQGEGGS